MPKTTKRRPSAKMAENPWAKLGLSDELLTALANAGFETPTEIQERLIPVALSGTDCLGQAKTGTGKTAAFALPIIQRAEPGFASQAIILVPTRELAVQVDEHFRTLSAQHELQTAVLYGGRRISEQLLALKRHPEVIVGTPGRILDLMRRKQLDISRARFAVLDEVDRMLDIGFRDDIRKILSTLKSEHQTIFVSATIDEEIRKLAATFMRAPVTVDVSADKLTVDSVEQVHVTVDARDKFETLLEFIRQVKPTLAIVFTNTKHAARRVGERLQKHGINCKEIHGDLMQSRREKVMKSFRAARIQVLVATDLASRGIDVSEISHIVNYDIPEDPSVYVHRIGRTARMGKAGFALTLATPEDGKVLTEIEKLINREVPLIDPPWAVRKHRPKPAPVEAPPETELPADPGEPEKPVTPERYREVLRRCGLLDAHGLQPVRRTLGSRFPSSRRRR